MRVEAWAAKAANQSLEPFSYDLPDPGTDEIQVKVSHCGLCHSDLSMLENAWQFTTFPLVPGHEVIGQITKVGNHIQHLKVGQTVGIGWTASSCNTCDVCVQGDQNLCNHGRGTIIGRHGGFASHINAQAIWALPIPEGVRPEVAGPLLCGGSTVFNPFLQFGIKPTDRVAVVGVGGLGHMALQFANKWGCEVTAFTSNPDKKSELHKLGAHHVVSSRESKSWAPLVNKFDFILVTANVSLDWAGLIKTLGPRGHLNFVGVVLDPVAFAVFDLLANQRQISASPSGAPGVMRTMLEFCGRHKIEPMCQPFKMSQVNAAVTHLKEGKARYRVVLESDF